MSGGHSIWQAIVGKHHAALVDELSFVLDSEAEAARTDAIRQMETTRRDTAEALNQTFRRMRQAASAAGVFQLLADGSAPWADKLVVLSIENNHAVAVAVRNVEGSGFVIEIESAGAIRSVVESKDPIVSLASSGEVSSLLAELFSGDPGTGGDDPTKAYLFPVMVRQNVVGVLAAAINVVPAPMEVLAEAAGTLLELLSVPASLPASSISSLVQITPSGVPAGVTSERRSWDELSEDDQKLHLQAQRVARVRIAELRLYHDEELRRGVFAGDIYSALRAEIDAARTEFLQAYLSKSPTMVDYLHLELLRNLAHNDDRLLGKDYPGPMV